MAESAPVPYGEISDTDIYKTQIGSSNEGGKIETGLFFYAERCYARIVYCQPKKF